MSALGETNEGSWEVSRPSRAVPNAISWDQLNTEFGKETAAGGRRVRKDDDDDGDDGDDRMDGGKGEGKKKKEKEKVGR